MSSIGSVTYSNSATPTLTAISPRFGSVLGGTIVTLSVANLGASSLVTVYFDNRPCIVTSTTNT